MSDELMVTTNPTRDAWLAERRALLTATDAAKILGLSKWGGPVDVYLDKMGLAEETVDNEYLKWGRRNEPTILAAYHEEVAPLVISAPYTITRSTSHPIIGATLDARRELITRPGVVSECDGRPVDAKNIGRQTAEWGEAGSDVMPLYYAIQLVIQMHVLDVDVADLAVLFSGNDFRVYHLYRDRETEGSILAKLIAFHETYLVPRVLPPIDGSSVFADHLAKRFRTHTDVVRIVTNLDEVAAQLRVAKEQLAEIEREKTRCENILKLAIGDDRGVESPRFRALWSKAKDGVKVDWEGVARTYRQHVDPVIGTEAAVQIERDHSTPKIGSRSLRVTFHE